MFIWSNFEGSLFSNSKSYVVDFVFSQTFLIKFACLLRLNCVTLITRFKCSARKPICYILKVLEKVLEKRALLSCRNWAKIVHSATKWNQLE